MSNWGMFKISLANHPGLAIGWSWPGLLAISMLVRGEIPPIIFWISVYPAVAIIPWVPILITAWTGRKQYKDEDLK